MPADGTHAAAIKTGLRHVPLAARADKLKVRVRSLHCYRYFRKGHDARHYADRRNGRFWHLTDNPAAPEFVRCWTKRTLSKFAAPC